MDQRPSSFGGASITEALPYEVLEEICKYLPKKDRENFALVCKTFYELVCGIERYKRPLVLAESTVIDENFVEGMLLSKRKIGKVVIRATQKKNAYTQKELSALARVLQKFPDIKVLKVEGEPAHFGLASWTYIPSRCLYDTNDLKELLDLMPNLEIIDIALIHLRPFFFRKLASMESLQELFIKFNCYGQHWTPTIGNALKEMIPRLQKYKITFDPISDTIEAALKKTFETKRVYNSRMWSYGLVLESS